MDIFTSHNELSIQSTGKRRNQKLLVAGVVTITGLVLACLLIYYRHTEPKAKSVEVQANNSVAELVSATGMVLTGKSGRTDWNQITVGARLAEGDLIQTDQSGTASIKYSTGATVTIQPNTIFTVRNPGDGSMDITLPLQQAELSSDAAHLDQQTSSEAGANAENGIEAPAFGKGNKSDLRPYMKLDRIIPFGRSLELIGEVEAGSRLTVNDESVEINGDGSFKHFTRPFPASAQKVSLVMKVTDLAGRSRVETATHDFNPHGGNE